MSQPTGITHHYKLNDNAASTTVVDSIGTVDGDSVQNTADISVEGPGSSSLSFNGTTDFIEIPDDDDFTPALTPFTVSAWVYPVAAANFVVASKGVQTVDGEWYLLANGVGGLVFQLFDNSVGIGSYIGRRDSTNALASLQNLWSNVVATYDGGVTSTCIKIYLNGIQIDDQNSQANVPSFVSVENLAGSLMVGRYNTTYSNGRIDNVMFFNRELTVDEILEVYNARHGTEIPAEIDTSRRVEPWERNRI